MNNMRTVIDIGNGYIKWVVFWNEDDRTVVLAKDMVKTRGMRKGKILDIQDFAMCINELLKTFAKKLWWDFIEEVTVWVSHPSTDIKRVAEQKRVLSNKIGHDDIWHLSDVVADASYRPNFEVIKIIPVLWLIDEETKTKDPLAMEARKLELIADVFMLPKSFYDNLLEVFENLDLQVVDIVPNILGAAQATLDFDLKDLWVILVDIWANQTSYVVYEEWYPLIYGVLPVWWEEVTKDISIWLQIDIKEAESIKREKWVIVMDNRTIDDESVDVRFLSDIMIARYEEIFELIQQDLIRNGKDWRLPGGVILTWGWSKVQNILTLAKDVFKLASFYGEDKQLQLWDLSQNQQFLSLLGDYVRIQKYDQGRWWGLGFSFDFSFMGKIKEFFKQLF